MSLTIEELVGKLGLEIDEGAFETGRKIMESLEHGLIGIGSALVAYAGGMQVLMHSTRAQAEDARVAAQELGLTTDAVQELDFAAEASGVSVEAMRSGLGHLARSLFEAQHGSAQATQAFYLLGGVGKHGVHDLDSALTALAEKFSKLPEGPKKVALAMELLGRGGRAMLPILNRGAEGLAELREEAHLTGYVIDKETIAQAHEWELADHRLKASLIGLRNEIVGPLLKGAGNLALSIAEFIRVHRPLIAGIIRKPYELLRDTIGWLTQNTWALRVALIALGGVMAAVYGAQAISAIANGLRELASTIVGLSYTLWGDVAAWAATALPIIATAAALVIAYLAFQDVYTFLKGGDSVLGRAIGRFQALRDIIEEFKTAAKDFDRFALAIDRAAMAFNKFFGDTKEHQEEDQAQYEKSLKQYYDTWGETPEATAARAEKDTSRHLGPTWSELGSTLASPAFLPASVQNEIQRGGGQSVDVGGITVNATIPPGGSPSEYGQSIAEQVRPVVREEMNRCNQEALMSIPPTADTTQP